MLRSNVSEHLDHSGGRTRRNSALLRYEFSGQEQRTTALLVAIRQAGYHVGWVKFWQLRTGELLSMVSATDARTGEKFVVHARSEVEATGELARWLGVDLDGDEA